MFSKLMPFLPVIMVASFINPSQHLQWIGVGVVGFMSFLPQAFRLLGLVGGGVVLIIVAVFSQMDLSFGLGFSFCLLISRWFEPPWERKVMWISLPYFSLLFFAPMDTRLYAGLYCLIGGYALFQVSHTQRRILYVAILAPILLILLMPISGIPITFWATRHGVEDGLAEESKPRTLVVDVGGHLSGSSDDKGIASGIRESDETDSESLDLPAQILEVLFNILLLLVLITLLRIIWMALVSRSKVFRVWWIVLLCFVGGVFFVNLWLANYQPEPLVFDLPGTMREGGEFQVEYRSTPPPEGLNGELTEPVPPPSFHILRMTLLWGLVVALIVAMAGWVWLIARKAPMGQHNKPLSPTELPERGTLMDVLDGLHGSDLVRVVYQQIRKKAFIGSDPLTPNELLAQCSQEDLEVLTRAFSEVEYQNRRSDLTDSTVKALFHKILHIRSQRAKS